VVLNELRLSPREAIVTWRPGQPLELPPPGRATTLLLRDVDQLTVAAQGAVLRWLDQSAGRIWVVSTSAEPLWPQVESGVFSDVLYYRLNIVCVHVPCEH
jgi:transcriptional regulator of acetoin/glycerol metabolism